MQKATIFGLCIILTAIIPIGRSFGSSKEDGYKPAYHIPNGTAQLSFEQLKAIIKKHNIKSIDELLPYLPEEYRKHYTLVYESHSAQSKKTSTNAPDPVSGDFPRVIMFGQEARLILAFTGNPKAEHFETLEVIEWDNNKDKFIFREIDFSSSKPSEKNPDKPIDPTIIDNPKHQRLQNCFSCHGGESSPRPNWDAYNTWPGVYGSISREGFDSIRKGSKEDLLYQSFLKTNRHSGRYKFLPELKISKERKEQLDEFYGRDIVEKFYNISNGASTHTNDVLTINLRSLNDRRIYRVLRDSPNYHRYKYALLSLLAECEPYEKFESFLDDDEKIKFSEYVKSVEKTVAAECKIKVSQLEIFNAPFTEAESEAYNKLDKGNALIPLCAGESKYSQNIAAFSYMVGKMGVDPRFLSTAFKNGTFQHSSPLYHNNGMMSAVGWYLIQDGDPDLDTFKELSNTGAVDQGYGPYLTRDGNSCSNLKERNLVAKKQNIKLKSTDCVNCIVQKNDAQYPLPIKVQREIQDITKNANLKNPDFKKNTLAHFQNYCVRCHSGNNKSYPLPLNNLKDLKSYRGKDGKTIAERLNDKLNPMPPATSSNKPSEEERAQMTKVIEDAR